MAIISKTYGRLFAILLSWLGFSAISMSCGAAYGTPSATFKAKGVVVSQTDNAPIEGIRAVLKTKEGSAGYGIDTIYTDNKGVFNLKSSKGELAYNKLYVELCDVDGDENGSFIDKDVEADYSKEKFKGGYSWYRGEAEKDLGIIKLMPKE